MELIISNGVLLGDNRDATSILGTCETTMDQYTNVVGAPDFLCQLRLQASIPRVEISLVEANFFATLPAVSQPRGNAVNRQMHAARHAFVQFALAVPAQQLHLHMVQWVHVREARLYGSFQQGVVRK